MHLIDNEFSINAKSIITDNAFDFLIVRFKLNEEISPL
jgi:hypothetical protein